MLVVVTIDFVSKFEHLTRIPKLKGHNTADNNYTSMFCKAIVIVIAALHCSFQLRKKICTVSLSLTNCSTLISEFAIKKLLAARLACRATCDLKTLARRIIPLAPGYRTALLSRPGPINQSQ